MHVNVFGGHGHCRP